MRKSLSALIIATAATPALALPVVDGTRDAEYGAPLTIQTVETQFGNANPPGSLGGSELNAGYARIEGGRLFIMLTGNLEPNLNKLEVFIDSKVGGENVLSQTPSYDFFNGGFAADYHLFARWGSGTGPLEVDFVDRQGGVNAQVPGSTGSGSAGVGLVSTGSIPAGALGPNASGSALSQALEFAINNNNNAGVGGGTAAADQVAAALVSTGLEFSIALADLGNPGVGDVINISAMINNGDHNYLSNQVLGGLPAPQGNLGGDGNGGFTGTLSGINFNNFAGNQYFSIVVPEPASLGLLAGLAGLALRRRR
jgi:hypothetical protein